MNNCIRYCSILILAVTMQVNLQGQLFYEVERIWNPVSPFMDLFGHSIALQNDWLAIVGNGENYVELRKFNGTEWAYKQTLHTGDQWEVNAVSMSDSFLVFSRIYEDNLELITDVDETGYLYVYKFDGNTWNFIQTFHSPHNGAGDHFGTSVKVFEDKIVATWYDPLDDDDAIAFYQYDGSQFQLEQTMDPLISNSEDRVDFNDNYLFVSSGQYTVGANSNQGAIVSYHWDGSMWIDDGYFTSSDGDMYDNFGDYFHLDGNQLIVGVPEAGIGGALTGAVYFYENIAGDWIETDKLVPAVEENNFGEAVFIHDNICFIRHPVSDMFAVDYYKHVGGEWVLQQIFQTTAPSESYYGKNILYHSGHLVISVENASNYSANPRGAVYTYEFCESVYSSISDTICNDEFIIWSGEIINTTGIYVDSLLTDNGCDSIATLILTVVAPNLTINLIGTTLSVIETSALYQWIDCSTMLPIAGATSSSYTPLISGSYACSITKFGCNDTTACTFVDIGGCSPPTGVTVSMITTTSAKISWTAAAGVTQYQIFYRKLGTATWQKKSTATTFKTLNLLLPATTYEYKVRSKCGATFSSFTPIATFTTL